MVEINRSRNSNWTFNLLERRLKNVLQVFTNLAKVKGKIHSQIVIDLKREARIYYIKFYT